MIFMGLGNAGSRILWEHYSSLWSGRSPQQGKWTGQGHFFAYGDADSNNSVLHAIKRQQLDRIKYADGGVRELKIDPYWRGGSGGYYILGQLVRRTPAQTKLINRLGIPTGT